MTGFLDSLKESALGKEMNLPICSLPRKTPLNVFYTYYEGKPRSHRLEFRQGKRTKFEMFLPLYRESIAQLCLTVEDQDYRKAREETVFGFWPRVILRFSLGTLVSCKDILDGPSSSLRTSLGEADSRYRYRLAYGRKGVQESIVLVSSRHSRHFGANRKSKRTEFNWIKLSLGEFRELVEHLKTFLGSKEFSEIQTKTEQTEHNIANNTSEGICR